MIQVTAITAAYNAASYIENCIQSVLAQTVPCRMVIVDDASRDDTYAIAMRYAEEYPDRITVLKNEQNAGAAASRNRAVACATTPYVAILDADDWWQEDKTERQLKRLAETKADACYAGRELMHADGISTTKIVQVPETVTYHGLLKGNVIPCSSVLMRREDALQYPMTHDELHEDYIVHVKGRENLCRCKRAFIKIQAGRDRQVQKEGQISADDLRRIPLYGDSRMEGSLLFLLLCGSRM